MRKTLVLTILVVLLGTIFIGCTSTAKEIEDSPVPTVLSTLKPTPTPTPEPTPTPTPDPGPYGDGAFVDTEYMSEMPADLTQNFKYSKQDWFLDYIVAMEDGIIFDSPDISSNQLTEIDFGDRMQTSAKIVVSPDDEVFWYRVHWTDKEENESFGYVQSSVAEYRTYQIDRAYEDTLFIEQKVNDEDSLYVYVVNRKNSVGVAPDTGLRDEFDKPIDEFGVLQDQSAPAYKNRALTGEFRYVPDGTLVEIVDPGESVAEVYIPQYDENYFIPREYLKYFWSDPKSTIERVTQSIVIDRKNQNIMYFEVNKETDEWEILSMSFVSTGTESEYADPTPLGFFMVQKKSGNFEYDFDGSNGVRAGIAHHVLRFSGGAYNHGVPLNYKKDEKGNLALPRIRESHPSLGVQPESHMCVRNYTSHAKFLYDRIYIGKAIIIVIE